MRVSKKGQVTIPADLRRKLGFYPATEVEFKADGDNLVLQKTNAPNRGKQIVERLRGKGQSTMTTDEIMALTRGD